MKRWVGLCVLFVLHFNLRAQVDTSYVYKTGLPYGTLDIRIAKSATRYYYLKENETVSFRESSPGVKTKTFRDMTSWDSSPYTEGNMREKNGTSDAFIMNYRLLFPQNYSATYSSGYPLILFIHGAGERGNCWNGDCYHATSSWKPATNTPAAPTDPNSKLMNNDHNLLHGGSVHLDMRKAAGTKTPDDPTLPTRAFQGFVLFPQNLNGWDGNSVQDAIRLLRLIAKKYNIDENRIYIEGLSNGGYGAYEAIKRAPWLFAAAVTMSAVSDAGINNYNLAPTIAHIPLWTFQGGQDTNPMPSKTVGYVKKFREAGAVVRFNIYENLGHGTWNTAFKEPDFFKWLRSQNKANIHVFADAPFICKTNGQGVRMELAAGFLAYQWEKNGTIISGATAASYVATTPGTYRARFSRKANPAAADWNQWSAPITVSESNPPQPQVEQIGTLSLKDLNNFGDAKLKAVGSYAHYYWYKNGTQITMSDTVSRPTFKAGDCSGTCVGNGTYTLVTAQFDNCPSPPSAGKYIYFNNQAPVNINAPTNFAGTLPNATSVKLTWTDASANESGFEIWRRKLVSGTTYTKWEMRTLTTANITTFTDGNIEPSSTYQYKIRAVSNAGKSNYTPSASNAYLVITTGGDSSAPTAPASLTATGTAINTITLNWQPSTDNTGIRQYRIYYGSTSVVTGSTNPTYTISGLTLNTVYTFTVKAEDLAGNLSAASNSATANTYVSGLYYEHSTGGWVDLNDIDWTATPEFTGKVTTFTLAPRTQEDYFNFEFDGYLYINTAGTYYFQTISSDGSRLELDGVVVVNNDGVHGSRTITSAAQTLTAGPKKINLKYFEFDESQVLTVRYKGPDTGNAYVTIPESALKSGDAPSAARMAAASEPAQETQPAAATVYPNPTTPSNINVQYDTPDHAPVFLKVMDFTGRQVFAGEFTAEQINEGVQIIPNQNMQDGIYLISITQNDKVIQQRLSIKN